MAQAGNLVDEINAEVTANKVMMYSKSYCPHCNMAKQCLQGKGIAFEVKELDQINNGDALQNALQSKTGQRTVPNIFVNGEHLGGNSDLQTAAQNGSLDAKLA